MQNQIGDGSHSSLALIFHSACLCLTKDGWSGGGGEAVGGGGGGGVQAL